MSAILFRIITITLMLIVAIGGVAMFYAHVSAGLGL